MKYIFLYKNIYNTSKTTLDMKYILTTFAEGNGPYVKTIGLTLAVNRELEERELEPFKIIVPHIYGEKQKRIIEEEFGKNKDIYLDEFQGRILKEVLFKGEHFQQNLEHLIEKHEPLQEKLFDYLNNSLSVTDLNGDEHKVKSSDISLELAHNPRFSSGLPLSFLITEGYISEILQRTIDDPYLSGQFNPNVLREAKEKVFDKSETNRSLSLMSEPAIFSFDKERKRLRGEIFTPPFSHLPKIDEEFAENGIYVAVTGIEGLQDLFDCVEEFGMKIYSNIDGIGERKHPGFITNPSIKYQFARSGWSSVWNGMFAGTPLITPPYQEGDNPEIYFNEKTLKELKLGVVYNKDNPADSLRLAEELRLELSSPNYSIMEHYGTRDGINYMANIITDYLEGKDLSQYKQKKSLFTEN